jgi:ABC-2 type transport system ATP-binding protein
MPPLEQPLAIEVRGVSKRFWIPEEHVPLRRRLRHPFNPPARELEVLNDISFEVGKGEFFGVIGRNGSGKSTLLKILASVYRADAGRIRMAGRLAPFLELGVGFNTQLAARENVIMNAVMMGLSPDQAAARVDEVIDFAGLREYTDMRLKNYSSGMKVRLAFSVLTQVDADIMLLDEVLAVGDSEFQEKCEGVFTQMREEGRTIVLVTHSMPTVNAFCDRALLIHDGRITSIGSPIEVSNQYLEINMRAAAASRGESEVGSYAAHFAEVLADPPVHIVDAWLEGSGGSRTTTFSEEEPIEVHAIAEVARPIERPGFQFRLDDMRGQILFAGGSADLELGARAEPGQRLRIKARVENRLAAGRYVCAGAIAQRLPDGSVQPATPVTTLNFEVSGTAGDGVLRLEQQVSMEVEHSDEPALR